MTRVVDIRFDPDERLSRTISADMLFADGTLKPQKLRLQVSVMRSSKGTENDAPKIDARFNGVVEITVADARDVQTGLVRAVCVDEPLPENDAHALLALITDVPIGVDLKTEIDKARALMAERMTVVQRPYK